MKKALLIGIDYHNDNRLKLFGCINDITLMSGMLMDALDYRKQDITMIRDDSNKSHLKPIKENILRELNNIVNEDLEEIWIHYSGHGTYRLDDDGDERDNKDEVIVPIDYKSHGIISDDMMMDIIKKSKTKTIITFDCCNSASLFDLPWRFEYTNGRFNKYVENNDNIENKNIIMFSACRDNQLAVDGYDNERRMSVGGMTPALIDTLRHNRYNVAVFKLFKDMCTYQKIKNREQITTLSSSSEFPEITFTRPLIMKKNNTAYSKEIFNKDYFR
uniref:Peptidase C14 caspase domain-containing protein n=1 Tax=viral metagenome TaxID=1070528 RepID=A0A6C0C4H9_9ZZZZ